MKKSIYLMHIPKTGGQYFSDTLISALNENCKNNNLNTRLLLKDGHAGWSERKEEDFTISIVRNPINRTVSHFLYYNPEVLTGEINDAVKKLMAFVETNEFINNYQSKFICSDEINYESNFNNQFFNYNLSNMSERVSLIDRLIKTDEISPSLVKNIYDECCYILNIPIQNITFPDYRSYQYLSPLTKELRDKISMSEVNKLTELNYLDFYLYERAGYEY